jgi:hypothetical protein
MLVESALMMKRREKIAEKFISGDWGLELKGFEEGQAADREADARSGKNWRR